MTKDVLSHMAPGVILGEEIITIKPFEELIEECFVCPVVLPEGRIVILEDKFMYHGRLIVPKTTERRPTTGRVLRVSNPDTLGNLLSKRIIYGTWSGLALSFKGESKYRVLECREVLGILENETVELEAE